MKKIYSLIALLIMVNFCFSANHTITIGFSGASTNNLTINAGDNVTFVSSGGFTANYVFTHNLVTNFSFSLNSSTPSYTHSFSIWDSYYYHGLASPLGSFHMIDIYVIPSSIGISTYELNSIKHYFQNNILFSLLQIPRCF